LPSCFSFLISMCRARAAATRRTSSDAGDRRILIILPQDRWLGADDRLDGVDRVPQGLGRSRGGALSRVSHQPGTRTTG